MFRNKVTYYAMACSIVLASTCIYIPGLNHVLSARPFKGVVYAVALGGFVAIVAVEVRKNDGHVDLSSMYASLLLLVGVRGSLSSVDNHM